MEEFEIIVKFKISSELSKEELEDVVSDYFAEFVGSSIDSEESVIVTAAEITR
jgi:intein-encoded DNA endonuclease-like protein